MICSRDTDDNDNDGDDNNGDDVASNCCRRDKVREDDEDDECDKKCSQGDRTERLPANI